MTVEKLPGDTAYISDLDVNFPAASDKRYEGDDHLRLIKRALKTTFPNITGTVTVSQEKLNQAGAFPVGGVVTMLFYQAAPPTGWSRVLNTATQGLRVVRYQSGVYNDPGGVMQNQSGDNPILNDKVPSHTHSVDAAATTSTSINHYHSVNAVVSGNNNQPHNHLIDFQSQYCTDAAGVSHNHGVNDPGHAHTLNFSALGGISLSGGGGSSISQYAGSVSTTYAAATGIYLSAANTNHRHRVYGTSGNNNQAHNHTQPAHNTNYTNPAHAHTVNAHNTNANASAANWAPRYIDVILCSRD